MSLAKIKPVPEQYRQNAVIYARYSSDKQTENSIDGQLRICRDYAERNGYTIIGEYIDRAVSGTTDNRPEFQQMIDDAEKQTFAFILVYRFDRFARNRFDSAIYKKRLEKVGVRVISASEHVGDGDEGIILESIYEAMDEAYSRRLSRITRRGMQEAAQKGLWTGGNIPLGYKVVDQRLTPDERTAPAVKLIYENYAAGFTKTQIAKMLNAAGYKTMNGNDFTCNNLTSIMRNRVYIGDYSMGDIDRTVPAIIEKDLFNKVQALQIKNRRVMGRKVSETFFALGGKIFCGMCGASMVGDSGTSRTGEKHYYYTCNSRKKRRGCKKKSERKDFIEWYVCEQAVQTILTPERIKIIAEKVERLAAEDETAEDIRVLNKRIADIDRQLDGIADAFIEADAALRERLNEKSATLSRQQAAAREERDALQLQGNLKITAAAVEEYLTGFTRGDLLDEDFRRRLINTLINAVYLFDDKVVIYFNLKGSKQVSYIDMIADLDEMEPPPGGGSDSASWGEPTKTLEITVISRVFVFPIQFNREQKRQNFVAD